MKNIIYLFLLVGLIFNPLKASSQERDKDYFCNWAYSEFKNGDYNKAQTALNALIDVFDGYEPDLEDKIKQCLILQNKAEEAIVKQQLKDAIDYYERILLINPSDPIAKKKIEDLEMSINKQNGKVVNRQNGKALAYSLIPGVGLMMKGHKAEGIVYMVGDVALLGGGFALMVNANKQRDIINDYSTGIDQYKSAVKKYNNSKTAAYCCFGTAAALYVVNLVRGYVAKPKPGARLQWAVIPSVAPSMYGESNMSVNLALSYKF